MANDDRRRIQALADALAEVQRLREALTALTAAAMDVPGILRANGYEAVAEDLRHAVSNATLAMLARRAAPAAASGTATEAPRAYVPPPPRPGYVPNPAKDQWL